MNKLKQKIKIGIVQTPLVESFKNNFTLTKRLIISLAKKKPHLIVLPEMFLGGPAKAQDRKLWSEHYELALTEMQQLARKYQTAFYFSYLKREKKSFFNTAAFIDKAGNTLYSYNKIHLFTYGNEHKTYNFGNKYNNFCYFGQEISGIICYDIRFPELSRILAHLGSKILLVSAQWPQIRIEHWEALLKARAIENQVFVVGCNRLGKKGKLVFSGNSLVFSPWGNCLLRMSSKRTTDLVEIDPQMVDKVRSEYPFFAERRGKLQWDLKKS